MDAVIEQYLNHYAEAEAQWSELVGQPALAHDAHYEHALVIPAFAETEDFLARVTERCQTPDTLNIVVVNAPESTGRLQVSAEQLKQTELLLQRLEHDVARPVLVIDRVSMGKRIAQPQGVGLARKIGTDVALRLFQQGRIRSPWLCQTDADARLPSNYFNAIANLAALPGAVVFAHKHTSADPHITQAAGLYDAHMQFYVQALAVNGSAYAYPTLGSTISVHAQSYARVRGYPKRNAGEDFYLLNKLNKLHPVQVLQQPVIEVQARLSPRVTFGTGPALQNIVGLLASDPSGDSYKSYDYRCFELLGHALTYLRNSGLGLEAPHSHAASNSQQRQIEQILQTLGVAKILSPALLQQPSTRQRQKLLNDWFDALKTLRFVHEAAKYYPDPSLRQTLLSLPPLLRNKITFNTGIE